MDLCDERPTESIRIPYPHIPLTDAPLVVCRLRKIRWFSSSSLVGVEFTYLDALEFPWVYWLISLPLDQWVEFTPVSTLLT